MRYWIGVAGGIGIGAIGGFIAGMAYIEEKVRKEYVEANASYKRALDMARKIEDKKEETLEEFAESIDFNEVAVHPGEAMLIGGPIVAPVKTDEEGLPEDVKKVEYNPQESLGYKPKDVNPYHEALEGIEDEEKHFTYLEEEDYQDEDDGFDKGQIEILMDGDNPVFLENGGEITDWAVKIGENIMRDFYTMVGPGEPQVLYVRNHQMETDYEVIRETP